MRILHLFKTYLPDSFTGVERVIWEIAEGTARHGITHDVLALSAAPHDAPLAVGTHTVHQAKLDIYVASTGLSLSVFGQAARLAQTADILHYHFPWPMMDLIHLLVMPPKPAVVTYHSDIVRQKLLYRAYQPLMHRFLARVDRIVATSPNYRASSPVLQRYADKTEIIPIGLGDIPQATSSDVARWRARVGSGFFLFVGALRYYKGLHVLADAARLSGLPIVIAGEGELDAQLRQMNLPGVQLVGGISDADKSALLELSLAFVFPSHLRSEAFGVALLEAARAGRAMISCELGTGTSFVNVHGNTGLIVPPGNAADLARAMKTLAADRDMAARFGAAARARYEALFTSDTMSDRYSEMYRDMLA